MSLNEDTDLLFATPPGVTVGTRVTGDDTPNEESIVQSSQPEQGETTMTPFDHVFINLFGWQQESDMYQALVQNKYTTIEQILADWRDGTTETLKFTTEDGKRFHAPSILEPSIQSFKYFVNSTEYYTLPNADDSLFLRVTPQQWKAFRRNYAKECFDNEQLLRRLSQQGRFSDQGLMSSPANQAPSRASSVSESPSFSRNNVSKADAFRRERREQSVFKVFKNDNQWLEWLESTRRQAAAQRCPEVLNSEYIAESDEDKELFVEQQRYMIAVWDTVLKTDKARQILADHSADGNAQAVFRDLVSYYTSSTYARIDARHKHRAIMAAQLNPSVHADSYDKYLLQLERDIREYEQLVPASQHFSDEHKKSIFENAVRRIPCLNKVAVRAEQIESQTGSPQGFDQYMKLLHSTASLHDDNYKLEQHPQSPRKSQQVYMHEVDSEINPGDDSLDDNDYDVAYEVYATRSRRSGRSPRLTKEQWNALSASNRKAWDKLSDAGKSVIINRPIAANVHELEAHGAAATTDSDETTNGAIGVHSTATGLTSKSKTSSHPASMKNFLGVGDRAQASPKESRKVTFTERIVCTHRYVVSNNIVSASAMQSLVDRGANGGVGGEDVRLLSYVPGRTVNIQGLDNHQLTSVRIGTVAGIANSTDGPVLLLFPQYAYLGRGTTVHSSVQMEHYGCRVDDRSTRLGGSQCIITPHGYKLPLTILDGLVRLPLRRPTNDDLRDMRQELMTSEDEWDPRTYDGEVDAYDAHDHLNPIARDASGNNLFDEFG